MDFLIEARGTKPLLMHNVQLADPLNQYAKKLKELNSKRTKTDEDREAIAEVEFKGGLYISEKLGPYVTDSQLLASIISGAKLDKLGRHVERGFLGFTELVFPLIYTGPRTMDGLWNDKNFVDSRTVGVQQNKVTRTRPIFREWGFEATVSFDTEILNPEEVVRVIQKAGKYAGVGDYRKLYGRFDVQVKEL